MSFQQNVYDALVAHPTTHPLLVVWTFVWREAAQGERGRSNGQIAKEIGRSTSHVRHALRCLAKLGVIGLRRGTRHGYDAIYVVRTIPDREVQRVLHVAASVGELRVDIAAETVTLDGAPIDFSYLVADTLVSAPGYRGVFWLPNPFADSVPYKEDINKVLSNSVTNDLSNSDTNSSKEGIGAPDGAVAGLDAQPPSLDALLAELAQVRAARDEWRTKYERLMKRRDTTAPTPEEAAAITKIFAQWQEWFGFPEERLTKLRKASILARLREGRTVEDILAVLRWASEDPWMRGRDPKSTRAYDDLTSILRPLKFDERLLRARNGGATTKSAKLLGGAGKGVTIRTLGDY